MLNEVFYGFSVALTFQNLIYCFLGVSMGTLVGVLPGLGPVAAMSLLFGPTLRIPPVSGMIMLAGIYYGAQYGGSTTSILLNIPGEASSVVTCLDGYQMARHGRAGPALGISAFGSFIGGTLAVVGLMLVAPPVANFALRFGFAEMFSLICLGLVIISFLARGSMLKAMMMAALGLFLGTIGTDIMVGKPKFTFGIRTLMDGVGLIPVAMGLFGISEIILNVEEGLEKEVFKTKISNLFPNLKDWKDSAWPIVRGTIFGFFLGVLPGGGAAVSSFTSYAVEKRFSKYPEKFGTGVIEGVAGPETANNSGATGAFVPLLTLGIPSNAVMALLLGLLLTQGVQVGPLLLKQHSEIFWGVVCSMYIGNVMLLVLNLPLIGVWVKILKVPYPILFPLILLFCVIGAYSLNNDTGEVLIMIFFGVVGYFMKKFDYEPAPLLLALILSPMMESNFRQALLVSQGSFLIFISHPISAALLIIALILLLYPLFPWFRFRRKLETLEED
ncbi:MAG: tripartite tricarboxylate transporter permease [Thermodesulfobacteriota bacterium]